ncbi:DctP family TRAP transporter solute-binding subunit [Texcoconibacillus texcoconensis]|uniref:C4-dicarboxylate-binding protein DctP n=1 Tax=Texcoconibacillus texcoconensis TaxID=1095777 RepID=A0A840QNT0_9BACI|nr:DctP family TRAP transporter solute-binding subunit [Texcoconibacillus texcoconensis]MBB5173035.1 C4-dicarboxylate-binding protein DctP [Texcoconibacillus texcoconensis]
MKGFALTSIFIVVGLLTAFYVGFSPNFQASIDANDEELRTLDDKVVIEFSHVVAQNTPKGRAAEYFAELVNEKTEGWVQVNTHPNGVLYEAQEEFAALKNNEVQMIAPAFSEITVHDPNWKVMDLPFLFRDTNEVHEAFEGTLGESLFTSIEQRGFRGLAFWDNNFKQFTNNESPLRTPDELANQTHRVMPSDVLKGTLEAFGAEAVSYPFNQVYQRLQNGDIDGTENTFSNIYSKGFYDHQRYVTNTSHNYLGYAVLTNPSFWDALPLEYQEAIIEALDQTTEWLRDHSNEMNNEAKEQLKSIEGVIFIDSSNVNFEEWEQTVESIYDEYVPTLSPSIQEEVQKIRKEK